MFAKGWDGKRRTYGIRKKGYEQRMGRFLYIIVGGMVQ